MAKTIDWLYRRKSCETCQKAQAFTDAAGVTVAETVDGTKIRIGPADVPGVLAAVTKVIAMRGKKVTVFDLKKAPPTEAELLANLIGPTGNLRAPTARVGKTLLVGFNDEAYSGVFG